MIYKTNPENEFDTEERCSIIEIMNSPEIKHLSVAQARVKPGITTALHSLDGDELYYILEGEGLVVLGESLKEKVGPGDLIHIKKDVPQKISNTSDKDLRILCICSPRFTSEAYRHLE